MKLQGVAIVYQHRESLYLDITPTKMKRSSPLFLIAMLALLGCDPGTGGTPKPDDQAPPKPADKGRPWAADQNLFDPNLLEGLPDPLSIYTWPFSEPFIKKSRVRSIEARGYSDADNPGLATATGEEGLVLGSRRQFSFDEEGRLADLVEERYLGDEAPATVFHAKWTRDASGKPQSLLLEETAGTSRKSHTLRFTYGSDGRVSAAEDRRWTSSYYGYDDARQHTYVLQGQAEGAAHAVWVIGKKGDFPDTAAMALAATIRAKESPFVQYAKAAGRLTEVNFVERDGRMPVRELHTTAKGNGDVVVEDRVKRQFQDDGSVASSSLNWDVENANIKVQTKYHYTPTGDLTEVFHQSQRFNQSARNRIDRYSYSPDGMLVQHRRLERDGQDPEETTLMEFFTFMQTQASPAAAVPTGSNE